MSWKFVSLLLLVELVCSSHLGTSKINYDHSTTTQAPTPPEIKPPTRKFTDATVTFTPPKSSGIPYSVTPGSSGLPDSIPSEYSSIPETATLESNNITSESSGTSVHSTTLGTTTAPGYNTTSNKTIPQVPTPLEIKPPTLKFTDATVNFTPPESSGIPYNITPESSGLPDSIPSDYFIIPEIVTLEFSDITSESSGTSVHSTAPGTTTAPGNNTTSKKTTPHDLSLDEQPDIFYYLVLFLGISTLAIFAILLRSEYQPIDYQDEPGIPLEQL